MSRLNLSEVRNIVTSNMPYDTGFMSLAGAKFSENNHMMIVRYDTERVPYIVYNEEGTIYTQKNKGFISEKTIGALLMFNQHKKAGNRLPFTRMNEGIKRRASTNMIKQGALEKISNEKNL